MTPGGCWKVAFGGCSRSFVAVCIVANCISSRSAVRLFGAERNRLAGPDRLGRSRGGDSARSTDLDRFGSRRTDTGTLRAHWMWKTSAASTRDCWSRNPASRRNHWSVSAAARWRRSSRQTTSQATFNLVSFICAAGMGRKASGSFYTPHEFVRFLVRETLDPKIAALSPLGRPPPCPPVDAENRRSRDGQRPFLVEACRHLGEALLTACRLCDERGLHDRIAALPDPDETIAAYLPSRGFSESRARAICRRLVAVHCLYGCDRNKLAIELAKLSLWLESYAEGLPLTFLDHRLVHGDALTGPFFASLSTLPVTGGALDPLLAGGVADRLDDQLAGGAAAGRDAECFDRPGHY